MEIPNLVGKTVEEGIAILERDYGALTIVLNEYTIPEDFRQRQSPLRDSSVRRILSYRLSHNTQLELIVATFNEKPHPSIPIGADD